MNSNRLAHSPILAAGIGLFATLWLLVSLRFSPPIMASVLAAPFLLVALLHKPKWGLLFLFLFLPYISAFEVKTITLGFNLGLPFFLGALWLIDSRIHSRSVQGLPGSLFAWFMAFILWTLICSLLSDRPASGLLQTSRWFVLFGFAILLWNVWDRRFQRQALNLYLIAIIPIAAYALWQVYTVGIEQIMFGRTVSLTP
ncbi:MAG: hypothetical protein HKN21_12085, partial [Candidatus Eisenbacteria bacterium]|nr:hypothetical protein [Candidatus Eisenbacteria bacterium]